MEQDILRQRFNAIMNDEIKNIKQYGDDYFDSGTGKVFGRLKRSLGDSGQGQRAFEEMKKANKDMGGDFTEKQLFDMFNSTLSKNFPDDSKYRLSQELLPLVKKAEGGELVGNQKELDVAAPFGELTAKDFETLQKRDRNAEGGEIDEQMSMLMGNMEPEEEMLPDEEMEDNYMDFILDEALTEEEEDMLMSKLEQDEQLAMLFDKVVEVASEFAGSGPVDGPGTGVSDSIPARLSDGEFVFTAKAVEEIGADNLMAMMKDAEMRADERQGMANGGEAEEEETVVVKDVDEPVTQNINVRKETVNSMKSMEDEDEIAKAINTKLLLDNREGRHVQS